MSFSNKTLADALRAAANVFEAADVQEIPAVEEIAEEIPAAKETETIKPIAETKQETTAAMGATDAKPAEITDAVKENSAAVTQSESFEARLAKAMQLLRGGK